ncbi:hypothetical protein DOTSEDRAFT_73861 [Dothistroma septosporum NZE10]|uniref:Uncharacterized protein n=1 Tax=Dothistroma septosporum (strain NZE10 / CBS 128990) TaxID=675120 RepID=N1PG24_DOTSN|nr:hypothetical protein DOTSEDRAFT_73861 [Dothistroma septosporum NZE10]
MAHELRKRKKPPQEQLDSGDALQPSPQKKPRARAAASKKDAGVNSSTSTGGGAAGTSLQGTPALSSNTDSTQSSSVFDVRLQDLPPPNPAARGLEAFRKGLQSGTIRLKPDAPHEFTPPTGLPRHIEAFPKIRDYRLLKGELQQYTILVGGKISTPKAADGSRKAVYADSHPVKVWRIKAQWRRADKPTQTIDYFVRPANYKTPQQAAITSAVCPTLEDATRLGQLVVDYTNKLPGDFNADDWVFSPGTNNIPNYSSGFLEVAALQAYSPEMDLAAALGEGFAPSADGKGIYRHLRHNSRNITSKNKTGKAANALTTRSTNKMACCLELVADDKVQPAQRSLSTLDDDFLAGVTVPPIPVSHAPFLGYIDGTSTDQALRSVHDRCQSVLFGTIGTNSQIKNMWDQERSKYQKLSTAGSQRADGIFNNLRLFSKSSTPAEISGGRRLELAAAAVCSALDFKLDKQTRRIPGAYFITASNNRILHSYILQQVVDSLSRKEGLMKAILKGHEAAFEVDTSLVRAPDVIRAALVNKDVVPIDSVVVCMHCPNVLLEVDAFLDDAGRRLCFPCSRLAHDAGSDVSSTVTVRSWSRRILRISINEDLAAGASKIDKELVCRALQTQIISDTEWISASSPGVKSITSAKWELGLNSTDPQLLAGRLMRFKHMDQPSVGKLMPMIVVGKKTHLHYADNDPIHQNVFLQTLEENHLQGTHTSGSQPVIAEAAQVAKILPPVTDQPSLEYPHEHRAFYNKFHRVALNDLMIIRSFPYTRKGRISQTAIKAADMPRLRRMWKRCNWDGKKMHRSQDFVITRAGMRNFNSTTRHDRTERQRFPPWEGSNFERIKQNVATIVAPGGRFNKHGLELLQNPDGSYWLGLPEERPEDADWEFEHREAEARLWTRTKPVTDITILSKVTRRFCTRTSFSSSGQVANAMV